MDLFQIALLIVAITAGILGTFRMVVRQISRFGWSALSTHYACEHEPQGQRFTWQSGAVGWANYNNCLTMIASHDGLYLKPMWPFSIAHQPLLIPWSELRNPQQGKWTKRLVKLRVGEPELTTLTLPRKVLQSKPSE